MNVIGRDPQVGGRGVLMLILAAVFAGAGDAATAQGCQRQQGGEFVFCRYQGFDVWMSCEFRAPVVVLHRVGPDTGNEDVSNRTYRVDEDRALAGCQQTSARTYSSAGGKGFDVGHLVAINHLDNNLEAALETNYMTNLLPQDSGFNRRGAWRQTERIVECVRDNPGRSPLTVMAGPVFGRDPGNDLFARSHGLPVTPDYYWKVLALRGNAYEAWLTPNAREAVSSDGYRVSLEGLMGSMRAERVSAYRPALEYLERLRQTVPVRTRLVDCGRWQD